ncbi:hypothetical protein Tco_0134493 [Tanacetum coccineum]
MKKQMPQVHSRQTQWSDMEIYQNGDLHLTAGPLIPHLLILLFARNLGKKLDLSSMTEKTSSKWLILKLEIILSQGLPRHIFNNSQCRQALLRRHWEYVEMIMHGSGKGPLRQRMEDLFDDVKNAFVLLENESIL